jgi:hypothetical protein
MWSYVIIKIENQTFGGICFEHLQMPLEFNPKLASAGT